MNTEQMKELSREISEGVARDQDIRLKCIEIAVQMIGPLPVKKGQTVQQTLEQYLPLSNVIELHVTGKLPRQAQGDF